MSTGVLQKLLWHAKRLFRTTSNSGSRKISPEILTSGGGSSPTFPPDPKPFADSCARPSPNSDLDYEIALTQSGFGSASPDSVQFLKAALDGIEWPKGSDLRRYSTQLSRDEVVALGYRSNVVLSGDFLAILTEAGRADPVHAAQAIVSALLSRRAVRRSIERAKAAGLSHCKVIPNNMAAGPCTACLELSKRVIPLDDAPLGPLPECPHPDQCVLRFRVHHCDRTSSGT